MSIPTAAMKQYLQAGSQLPVRLRRFFAEYPPQNLARVSADSASSPESTTTSPSSTTTSEPLPKHLVVGKEGEPVPNPFLPHKSPISGRWHNPVYSLRRQADLVKLAQQHGVEDLLPFTVKGPEEKLRRMQEVGPRMRGTGIGQRVKGHKWERQMVPKLEERRKAMWGMPQLVRDWKEAGHGRGWKKWPR